jgi:DNA-binding transcriptional MerR regulator
MLQIGDFSKLAQVSIKALRYYDQIGLLKPTRVDDFTNFRYYSVAQLPRLNRIIALKEIGFSLEQIARLIDDDLSSDQIKGMLILRQAEVEQAMQTGMARLTHIQSRLNQIECEGKPSTYDVIVKPVESQTIASVRRVIPTYSDVGTLFSELFAGKIQPIGPRFAIYHDGEYRDRDADVEAGVIVEKGGSGAHFRELEAVTMATTIHPGSYETVSSAYSALMQWLEHSTYKIAGPNREIYLLSYGESHMPHQFITEVQISIEAEEGNK